MGKFRLLPWEYGVRNLFRRPSRTLLTLMGLTLVVLLVLVVVGFIRGLERSLAVSGDPRVVLIHAPGGSENVENSTVAGRTAPVLAASVEAVQRRYGQAYVSPEIFLGTRVAPGGRKIGEKIEDFTLTGPGERWSLAGQEDARAVVVVFLSFDCPASDSSVPTLAALHKAYSGRGVVFLGVNASDRSDADRVASQAGDRGIPFPVLKDVGLKVADTFRARVAPEAFVLDHDRVLRYRGRVDNADHLLRDAIEAVLAGEDPRVPVTQAAGCPIRREGSSAAAMGLVRGVSPSAHLVRRQVQITEGRWPGQGEVLAGRLAAAKIGCRDADLAVGQTLLIEGREWTVSGRFACVGSALESELWLPLGELQTAMKRQDCSLVAVTLAPGTSFADVDEFCKERLDLEVQATREVDYYANLQKHYGPVRAMAWLVVLLVAAAGVFAGMNAMYGSVVGRVKELATLQTLGFTRRAITLSLIQEAVILAAAAALVACGLALVLLDGVAVRFTMGAFALRIDGPALLLGCGTGVALGVLGALPPAYQAMRLPIVDALKAV